jgi:MFS family permease
MEFSEQTKKRALQIIFLIMLMDVVGMSIIFPVAPYIVQRYSGKALMVAMLTVIYAGAQFFAAPALGKISDRVGRRPVLLVSVFGSAIGYFIFGIGGVLAAGHVSEHEQGQLAGVNAALAGLMSMLGPLWAGAAYDHVAPGSPYWLGAAILGIASVLLRQVRSLTIHNSSIGEPSTSLRNSQLETGD